MAIITTTSVTNQFQGYFDKRLLEHAIQALSLNDYAKKADLPQNVGSTSISFFRPITATSANVQTLAEGTPISNFTDLTYSKITVNLAQYGEAVKITDILKYTQLFDAIKQGITLMGEDCALKADDITRNAIVPNITGTSLRYSQGITNFANLSAATASGGKFVATDALDAVTQLRIGRAPMINNAYVGIVPPQIGRDLMNDNDWLQASKYSAVQQLFKGEIGMLHGVRFVIATNPFRETSGGVEGTFVNNGTIFSSIFTGRDAYGVPSLTGNTPFSPRMIISDKPDKSDPLNQFVTVGWKAFYGATLLNNSFLVVMKSKTEFV